MSDVRLQTAREMLEAGRHQEAMALLKQLLKESPEDNEVRQALMDVQEQMMLAMQLGEKVKKARSLLAEGQREAALKAVSDVLKVAPTHSDALALQRELEPAAAPAAGPGEFDLEDLSSADGALPSLAAPASADFQEFEAPELPPLQAFDFGSLPEVPPSPAAGSGSVEATRLSAPVGAASTLSATEQAKVRQYLDEGKALQRQGRVQDAIDMWTRVFILDEENAEAQSLIDQARASLTANQGELEYTLTEAIAAFNGGDFKRAKPLLEKILQMSPGHREAQHYLTRIPAEAPAPPPTLGAKGEFELEGDFGGPAPAPAAPGGLEGFELETGGDFPPPPASAPAPSLATIAKSSWTTRARRQKLANMDGKPRQKDSSIIWLGSATLGTS